MESAVVRAPRLGRVHWEYVVPIGGVHLLACLALLPWCFSWSGVILALVGTNVFGTLGINLCYHRLLAHRSLTVPRWLERSFATLALCSFEDTPARWVANHRLHHVHSDEELDPHSPRDGIGWSHAGWLFRAAPQRRTYAFFEKYARDILADDYYRWLERKHYAVIWIYLAHAVLFALAGYAVGWWSSGDRAESLRLAASWVVWGVYVRTVLVWHITWSVNSLTHLFGYRTYETSEDGVNFNDLALKIRTESPKLNADGTMVMVDGKPEMAFQDYAILNYGPFIQSVIDFLLVAVALFIVIKIMNTAKARFEEKKVEQAPPTPEDVVLLREIRDALARR